MREKKEMNPSMVDRNTTMECDGVKLHIHDKTKVKRASDRKQRTCIFI